MLALFDRRCIADDGLALDDGLTESGGIWMIERNGRRPVASGCPASMYAWMKYGGSAMSLRPPVATLMSFKLRPWAASSASKAAMSAAVPRPRQVIQFSPW